MSQPESHEPVLRFEIMSAEDRTAVAAVGELDMSVAALFDATLREQLAAGPVLVDLSRLTFMDSTGVRMLDGLLRDADRHGWSLVVRSDMHRAVRQVLELTGVMDVLPTEAGAQPEEPR